MPGNRLQRLLIAGTFATLMLLLQACQAYLSAKAFEQHAPLREGSLASWIPRKFGDEDAMGWLMCRSAVVVGRADYVGLSHDGAKKLSLKPMRAGEPVAPTLGSAVAITEDGYFVTAAHCISDEPYVIVARDRAGNYIERLGRTVWSGAVGDGRTDVALIHAPELSSDPIKWCSMSDVFGGAEVLSAGVGVGASRFAAGTITGGPTGTEEALPGRALSIHVDSPLIPGDSGGPTILTNGRLLGICANVEIEVFTQPGGGEILRPDPAFIQQLIETDRLRPNADPPGSR